VMRNGRRREVEPSYCIRLRILDFDINLGRAALVKFCCSYGEELL
jgi:hypothetical protein